MNKLTNSLFREKYILWIFLIGLAVSLPASFYGLFTGYDFKIHLVWSRLFFEEFSNGTLYPRWLSDAYGGYGSPVFYFYPPLPYFVSLFTYWLFSALKIVWLPLTASFTLAIILSGFTSYLWLKKFFNDRIAFFGSLIYMLYPYHLGVDFYNRAAFAETWSFVWLPLLILQTHNLLDKKKYAVLLFALFYASLILTHLPTALIFSPFPLLYYIFNQKKIQINTFFRIFAGYIVGIGLTAFYLLPAISYQKYVQISSLKRFKYFNNFLFSNPNTIDSIFSNWLYNNFIIIMSIIIVGTAFLSLKKEHKRILLSWHLIFMLAFFMMTPLSLPVWKIFSFLQIISFPWRFLVIVTLAFTFILSYHLSKINHTKKPKYHRFFMWILVLALIGSNFVFVTAKILKSKNLLSYTNAESIYEKAKNSASPPEYLPINVNADSILKSMPAPALVVLSGKSKILHVNKKSGSVTLSAKITEHSTIRINQFYFSGWRQDNGQKNIGILHDGFFIKLSMPNGNHNITIKLNKTIQHLAGNYTTIFFLSFLLIYFLYMALAK